jgi:nucleoside-diphosphate-sugar epimerase
MKFIAAPDSRIKNVIHGDEDWAKLETDSELDFDQKFNVRVANGIKGSRILLTGATGLVGSSILYSLNEVARNTKIEFSLFTHSTSELQSVLVLDSLQPKHLVGNLISNFDAVSNQKYDYIIHAGGPAQPLDFMRRKKETFLINSVVTAELLNLLEPDGRFVFLSSSELYSGLKKDFFLESEIGSSVPSHPRACYIEGKRAGEMFVNWGREDGKQTSSLRLSYTYGPGSKAGDLRVINQLIESAINLNRIELKDSGGAVRTNLYTADAAKMILSVLLNPIREVYNIGGVQISSIKQIAEKIAAITNSPLVIPPFDKNYEIFSQESVRLDISAYIEDFGMPRFTDLEQGLRQTIDWQRLHLYGGVS